MHRLALLVALLAAPAALAQSEWDADYPVSNRITETTFIHAGPSEDRSPLAIVHAGSDVRTNACEGGWCPVKHGDVRGFVEDGALASAEYLSERPRRPTANPDVYDAPARPVEPRPAEPAPAAPQAAPPSDAERIVGSKRSGVYHRASCRHVARIAAHNLVTYESAADAESQGKRPGRACHPSDG